MNARDVGDISRCRFDLSMSEDLSYYYEFINGIISRNNFIGENFSYRAYLFQLEKTI